LYCAPERLGALVPRLVRAAQPVSLLAVDEAHCIVEWGNEFRPVYRRLGEYRYRLQRPPTIALTGSATPAARAEILQVLRLPHAELVVTSFDRANLVFAVERVSDDRAPRVGKLQSRDAALRRSASLPPAPTARVFRRTGGAVQRLRSVWDEPGALSCAPRNYWTPLAGSELFAGRNSEGRACDGSPPDGAPGPAP